MKSVIAALCVLAAGVGASIVPAFALDGPGRALFPSDTQLQVANDPVVTSTAGGRVARYFIPPYSGVVRVKWDVRSGNGDPVYSEAAVVHLSSCQRPSSSTAFVTKSCNIRVQGGMPIEITAGPNDGFNFVELRNIRLYYRMGDSSGETIDFEVQGGQ